MPHLCVCFPGAAGSTLCASCCFFVFCPCSSCSMVSQLAARCSRGQPLFWPGPFPAAPSRWGPLPCPTVAFNAVSALSPPLRASTMRGKPPPHALLAAVDALRRRRPHARPSGPRRSTPAMRAILHALSRPPSPCQGQGLCLLVYGAVACLGAVHPPSLCRVCNTTLAAIFTICFEGGACDSACLWGRGPKVNLSR